MKKKYWKLATIVLLVASMGFIYWKSLKIEKIVDDLYLVNGESLFLINKKQLNVTHLSKNPDYKFIRKKILKAANIPAIFNTIVLPGEQNIIIAWVSKSDNTQVMITEINTRLSLIKSYRISLSLGPDLKLLDPVDDLRFSRGGGDGTSGLGCEYGGYQSCIWVIPRVEPLKRSGEYEVSGVKVRYADTIAFPVVERFYNKVEYRHMYETIWSDQPILGP